MVVRSLNLSAEGKKEVGHIFKDGVPLQDTGVFSVTRIDGLDKVEVFHIDWASLVPEEQDAVVAHLQRTCGGTAAAIQDNIAKRGSLLIRAEYLVFSVPDRAH